MIDEIKTFYKFRYYSTDLKPKSRKKVIVICDGCRKERVIKIQDYRGLCPSCSRLGKRNKNYNYNLTDEERINKRMIYGYKEWRNLVFKRDDYTCQVCDNNKGGDLNAHHLESYANNKKLRVVVSNGITVCKDCHMDFHHQYGNNNTKEQFIEFMGDKI